MLDFWGKFSVWLFGCLVVWLFGCLKKFEPLDFQTFDALFWIWVWVLILIYQAHYSSAVEDESREKSRFTFSIIF